MSEDTPKGPKSDDARPMLGSHVTYDGQGALVKWLIGIGASAAVIGGGVFAFTAFGPGQRGAEVARAEEAYIAPSSTTPFAVAGPMTPVASRADDPAAASPAVDRAAAPTSARPRAKRRDEPVPEMVVGVASADAARDDGIVVTGSRRPVWTRTPSARRLSALYPERALDRGREGEASVHCTVKESGALDCERLSETPARAGFGNAALRVARTFRHETERADGTSAVGAPLRLRVVFRLEDEDRRRT